MKLNLSPILRPWVFSFALAMLAGIVLLSVSREAINEFVISEQQVDHSHTIMSQLEHLASGIERTETARRAYSISHNERHLATFYRASEDIQVDFATLKRLTADSVLQQQDLAELSAKTDELVAIGKSYIDAKKFDIATSVETLAQTKALIDQSRALIGKLLTEESRHLSTYSEISRGKLRSLKAWMMLTGFAFIAALCLAFVQSYREISQRRKAELYLLKNQRQNVTAVHKLSLMGEMTNLLQSCTTIKEALNVISKFAPLLIPVEAGALYLFRESRNLVEIHAQWGLELSSEPVFEPHDCWALRRGEPHIVDDGEQALACRHLQVSKNIFSLCIPIVAQGDVLGILHLESRSRNAVGEPEIALARNLANEVALAMASIRMRETLRNLSVRDSLTGLFNRHYLEESMQRELANAERKNRQLALVMLDLDYFKNFNDSFGHEAGDMLLSEVGALLGHKLRSSDIACRLGGEEFVLIFCETEPEIVLQLVNQLREGIAAMRLQSYGQSLGQITASFGLAFYPMHGNTMTGLMRAADQALYKAKAEGRNRVEIAETAPHQIPLKGKKPSNDGPDLSAGA